MNTSSYTHHLFVRKLHIERLERFDETSFAIRFVGHRDEFMQLIESLRAESYENAHWNAAVFDGRGGWVIDVLLLDGYSHRFDNYEQCMKQLLTQEQQGTPF